MNDKQQIAVRLKAFRNRAGLSMSALAELIGMAGASSYQRYESPKNYARKEFLPLELTMKIGRALEGKGNPPIDYASVIELAGIQVGHDSSSKPSAAEDYSHRQAGCLFCEPPIDRVIAENDLAYLSRGVKATNAALVERAVTLLETMNVNIMGPEEVRQKLKLTKRS